jgi:hypothetical protein
MKFLREAFTYNMYLNNIVYLIYKDRLVLRFIGLPGYFGDCNILNVGQVSRKVFIEPYPYLSFKSESNHLIADGKSSVKFMYGLITNK